MVYMTLCPPTMQYDPAKMAKIQQERRRRPPFAGAWYPPTTQGPVPYDPRQTLFCTPEFKEMHDRKTYELRYPEEVANGIMQAELSYQGLEKKQSCHVVSQLIKEEKEVVAGTMLDVAIELITVEMGETAFQELSMAREVQPGPKYEPHTLCSLAMRSLPVLQTTSRVLVTGAGRYEMAMLTWFFVGRVKQVWFDEATRQARHVRVRGTHVVYGAADEKDFFDVALLGRDEERAHKGDGPIRWENIKTMHMLSISTSNPVLDHLSTVFTPYQFETLFSKTEEEVFVGVPSTVRSTGILGHCDACDFVRAGISRATIIGPQVYRWWTDMHYEGTCKRYLQSTRWATTVPTPFARQGIEAYPCEAGKIMSWSVRQPDAEMTALFASPTRIFVVQWSGPPGEYEAMGADRKSVV